MNKLFSLILVIIMVLLAPSIFSWSEDTDVTEIIYNNSLVLYQCDVNTTRDNSTSGFEATIIGTVTRDTGSFQVGSSSCGYTPKAGSNFTQFKGVQIADGNFSVGGWVNPDNPEEGEDVIVSRWGEAGAGTGNWRMTYDDASDYIVWQYAGTNNAQIFPATGDLSGAWHHVIGTVNHSGGVVSIDFYLDGVHIDGTSVASSILLTNDALIFGLLDIGTNPFDGNLDEMVYENYTMDSTHIKHLFDLGVNTTPVYPPQVYVPPPIPENINNTKPNITISYPVEYSTIGNTTDYPLLIYGNITVQNGSIVNTSINSSDWLNAGNVTNFNFTFNGTMREGIWIINITTNSTYGNQTSEVLTFTIDLTEPVIQSSLSRNNTLIYAYTNLTYNLTFSDSEKVYSFNVSTLEGYLYETTGVNATKYIYNGSINVSAYGIGKHILTTETCDAHTKNEIGEWEEVIGEDKRITYNFGGDYFFIRPLDPTLIGEVNTNKLSDRYTFTYKKNTEKKKEDFIFIISSTQYIDILGNDKKYSGWLVIPKLNKWIDFNNKDKKKLKYTLTRLSDYSVAVEIKGLKGNEFTFDSAGDLNCIRKDYSYYIYNYTVSYDARATSGTPTKLDFSIIYKDIPLNSTAILKYNYTSYTAENISTVAHINYTINVTPQQYTVSETDINFTWNYTLNDTKFTILYNYTQTIDSILLVNYGNLSNASAINFTLYNESSNKANILGAIRGTFYYLTSSVFSPILAATTNLSVAIYPTGASTSGSYVVYYSAAGFPERRYTETTAIYNNNTQLINLYLLPEGEGAYATFRIIDIYSNPIVTVEGTMQKLLGGTLKTIEQQTSDGSGVMTFFVNPDDDYTFIFSKEGYVTYSATIRPITTEIYTVTLQAEGEADTPSYSTDITYLFTPANIVLNNDTNYNFTFNLTSGYWDITDCTLALKNTSNTLISSSSSYTTRDCSIRIEFNTGHNFTTLISEATYQLNGTVTEIVSTQYSIKYTYIGEFSFMNFIDDLRAFAGAGFNDFTRMILAFIVIFSIVAVASSQISGFRDPESLIILAWGLVLFFSYVGFLTVNYESIPDIAGVGKEWLQQYIIFLLFSLGAGSYIINKHK